MNIGEFLGSINRFDLLVLLFLFGMFVLGFVQGTIRRLLGLGSMLFSFLLASNLREPLGTFLAANWNQFQDEYAVMVGYATVFLAATVAFTLVIQGFYKRQTLFQRATVADEVIGGLLGILQGVFLLGCMVVILDSYFEIPTLSELPGELIGLREIHDFYDNSNVATILREVLIPAFFTLFGLLIPSDLRAAFGR